MKTKRHPLTQAIRVTLCAAAMAAPSAALLAAQSAHAGNPVLPSGRQQFEQGLPRPAGGPIYNRQTKGGSGSDYGDAPAPYRTLVVDGGPSHPDDGPTLGALRDNEADGAPTAAADGDDLTDSDDEDGIAFGTLQIGATDAGVVVNVQGEAGKLDAWIDLNADGAWTGSGEHVFDSVDVATGDNLLFFDLPAQGRAGARFGRFRISRTGELGPDGAAADGEVEDHALALQAPSLSASTFYDSGHVLDAFNNTQSVLLADLDGDGDLDLFEGNYGASGSRKSNRVRFNDGSGNFVDSGQSLDSDDTFGTAAADYDGDGDIDLAAANIGQRTKLYLNDGAGGFTLDQTLGANSAADVAFADLDSDGDPDLIIGVLNGPNVVFVNDGSGLFSDSGQALGNGFTLGITVGDVDRDGDIDFVDAVGGNERNRVYLNDGVGTFTDSGQGLHRGRTLEVDLGDVDGDGDLDLIESTSAGSRLRLNDGSGDFSAGATALTSSDTYSAELVDMDGDGDLDLVEGNYFQGARILLNDGSGGFSDSGQSLGSSATYGITVGDVDGDGDIDLIEGNYGSANTLWLNGDADFGDAPAPHRTQLADNAARHALLGPSLGALRDGESDGLPSVGADGDDLAGSDDEDGIAFGTLQVGATDAGVVVNVQGEVGKLDAWIDFNGDGAWTGPHEQVLDSVDVVIGDNTLLFDIPAGAHAITTLGRFRLSREGGLGTDGFAASGEVEDHPLSLQPPNATLGGLVDSGRVLDAFNDTHSVLLADLDGDGDLDLFEGNYGGSVSRKINRVRFNDGAGNFVDSGQSLDSDDTFGTAAADYDGDGDIDLAAANLGQGTKLYLNDGAGGFTLDQTLGASLAADAAFTDLDSDGDPDLIIGVLNGPNEVFLNNGSGGFSTSGQALGNGFTRSIAVGDVDRDGDIDFIEALGNNERNRVYLNDGSGVFTDSGQLLTNNLTLDVDLGDVDGDGNLDLIESTLSGTRLRLNDGFGDFSAGSTALSSSDTLSAELVDMDGDGDLDLVEGNYNQSARILLNDGGGAFGDSGQSLGSSATYGITLGDVDGDGDIDLIEGNYGSANTLWLNTPNTVNLSVGSNSGSESAQTQITVTATTAFAVSGAQSVDLSIAGVGITAGDYTLSSSQIMIPDGASSGSVTFDIVDDAVFEGDETATLSLSGYSLLIAPGATISQDVQIIDNDSAPMLSALDISPDSFGEDGGAAMLTATLSNASVSDTCIDLGFAGTATFDVDYTSSDDDAGSDGVQVCVAAGDTTGVVDLTGLDDDALEGDEDFGVSAGGIEATATVVDDELPDEIFSDGFEAP